METRTAFLIFVLQVAIFTGFFGNGRSKTCSRIASTGREFLIGVFGSPVTMFNTKEILVNVVSTHTCIVAMLVPHLNVTEFHTVQPGVTSLHLPKKYLSSTGIDNKGIILATEYDVTMYVITDGENAVQEGFLVLPVDWRDNDTFVVSSYKPGKPSFYLVVASNDNTHVTIHNRTSLVKSFQLNSFQTYQFDTEDFDPSGLLITVNDSSAVFSGSECSSVLDQTHCQSMAEQLMPVSTWGTRFVVPALLNKPHNVVRIYTSNQPAKISLHNYTGVFNIDIDAFDFAEILFEANVLYIHAFVAVQVFQYSTGYHDGEVGDSFMAGVPPVDMWMSSYTYRPVPLEYNYTHYLAVSVHDMDAADILLNGSPIQNSVLNQFVTTFEGMYDVITVELSTGQQYTIQHRNASRTFGTLAYGFAFGVAYGFTLGLQTPGAVCDGPPTTASPMTSQSSVSTSQGPATHTTPTNGLTCFACTAIASPQSCNTTVTCQPDQICFIKRYKEVSNGQTLYTSGCRISECRTQGRRFLTEGIVDQCEFCCKTDRCNTGC